MPPSRPPQDSPGPGRLAPAAVLILLTWLGGCANPAQQVESSVTRFHVFSQAPASGKPYRFLPDATQEGRLEFRAYAQQVERHLSSMGFRPETPAHPAEIGIILRYGQGESRTEQRTLPIYGQTGGGPSNFQLQSVNANKETTTVSGTAFSPPVYNVIGTIPVNRTLHAHYLHVDMVDLTASTQDKPVFLFEGKVNGVSERSPFAEVAPCLIQSLFRDFPGPSGAVRTYQDGLESCGM